MDRRAIDRRAFLKASAAVAAGVGLAQGVVAQPEPPKYKKLPKAVVVDMAPKELSDLDKFKLLKQCGFDGVEVHPAANQGEAERLRDAAREAGIEIHSIMYGWGPPFSSADYRKIETGLLEMEAALRSAKVMGATAVLLVPAVVNADTSYADAYTRSQAAVRKMLPLAAELQITIAVEFVWNYFLLSPLEFARYVDEFESPWLRAYFDCGNVVKFGWPEQWIRILGKRIVKVHLKDFSRTENDWRPLLEGEVNWPEVRRALADAGYSGYLTAELGGGDEAYLRDVSERMDKIIAGG